MRRHLLRVLLAIAVVMILAFVGNLARVLYIAAVRPKPEWVTPRHDSLWATALSLGLAAGAVEAIYTFSGARDRASTK